MYLNQDTAGTGGVYNERQTWPSFIDIKSIPQSLVTHSIHNMKLQKEKKKKKDNPYSHDHDLLKSRPS